MKKLLVLLLLSGLVFTTNSCKKKTCPEPEEPEVWAPGTWNAFKVEYQGQDITNSGDPYVNCDLTDQVVLNDGGTGTSWVFPSYDSQNSVCSPYNLQVVSWAENLTKKKLYVTVTYNNVDYGFEFDYVNDSEMMKKWSGGDYIIYYQKQ